MRGSGNESRENPAGSLEGGGGHESTFTFSSYFYYVINNASSEPEGRTEIEGMVIYSRAICRLYSRFYLVACNC